MSTEPLAQDEMDMPQCICGRTAKMGELFTIQYKAFEYNGAEYVRCAHGDATLGPKLLRRLKRMDHYDPLCIGHENQDATLVRLGLAEFIEPPEGSFSSTRIHLTAGGRTVLDAIAERANG